MIAFELSHSNKNSRRSTPKTPLPLSTPTASHQEQTLVQRSADCACGGGCPRCNSTTDHADIQTKLAISTPGDQYEQEADRVADQVMRMSNPQPDHNLAGLSKSSGSLVQRNCSLSVEEEELQRKEIPGCCSPIEKSHDVSTQVHEALHSPAVNLDPHTRAFMEPRFGHDFNQVRVHADSQAAAAAKQVSALAFTVGHDIVFGSGQFAPDTPSGKRLLAHELAHVVQQKSSAPRSIQRDVEEEVERGGEEFRRERRRDLSRIIEGMRFRKIAVDCPSSSGVRLLDVLSRMRGRVNGNAACLRFFQQNFGLSPDRFFLPTGNPTITVDPTLTVSGRTRCPEPSVRIQQAVCGSPLRERVIMHEFTHYAGCLTRANAPSSEALAEQGADICMGTVQQALDAARQQGRVTPTPVPQQPTPVPQQPTPETGPVQRKQVHDRSADVNEYNLPLIGNVLSSSGAPLDAESREFFESRFGHNFSNVRVHSDVQAAESARQLRARAYTVGPNIVFGAGQYQPQTTAGRHLIAHELTHALQQSATKSPLVHTRAAPHIARAPLDLPLLDRELNAGGTLTQSHGEIGFGSARGAPTDPAAEDTSLPIEAVVHRRHPAPPPPPPPSCGHLQEERDRRCSGSIVNMNDCFRIHQYYLRCMNRPPPPPPDRALIVGGIHGDEGGLVASGRTPGRVLIAERLRTELSGGLQRDFDTILVPVMNPGGLIDGTRTNRHRVDLNRNFPGLSGFPAGRPRIEQPETTAVRNVIEILRPSRILALHAHSNPARAGFFADPVEGEARELACRMALQVFGTSTGTGAPASNVMVRGNQLASGVCESRYPDASSITVTTTQSSLGAWGSAPTSAGGRGTTVITHEIPGDATPLPESGTGRSVDTVMPGIREFLRDHRRDPSEADALLRRSVTTTFLSGQATAADERLRDTITAIVDSRFKDLDAFYRTIWRPAQPAAVRRRLPANLTNPAPSHTRDFQRQASIVLGELRGLTATSADADIQAEILRVMETRSLPGFSRHHWGSELDILSATRGDWDPTTGRLRDLIPFLQEHAFRFGFFHPYTAGYSRSSGAPAQPGFPTPAARHYLEEPWHVSYWPIANVLRQLWIDNFINPATQQVNSQLITDTAQAIRGRVPQATMERVLNSIGLGSFQTNVAPSP